MFVWNFRRVKRAIVDTRSVAAASRTLWIRVPSSGARNYKLLIFKRFPEVRIVYAVQAHANALFVTLGSSMQARFVRRFWRARDMPDNIPVPSIGRPIDDVERSQRANTLIAFGAAPAPGNIIWKNAGVGRWHYIARLVIVNLAVLLFCTFLTTPAAIWSQITAIDSVSAKIREYESAFAGSVVFAYVPTLLLVAITVALPYVLILSASVEGHRTKSVLENSRLVSLPVKCTVVRTSHLHTTKNAEKDVCLSHFLRAFVAECRTGICRFARVTCTFVIVCVFLVSQLTHTHTRVFLDRLAQKHRHWRHICFRPTLARSFSITLYKRRC